MDPEAISLPSLIGDEPSKSNKCSNKWFADWFIYSTIEIINCNSDEKHLSFEIYVSRFSAIKT